MTAPTIVEITLNADNFRFLQVSTTDNTRERNKKAEEKK